MAENPVKIYDQPTSQENMLKSIHASLEILKNLHTELMKFELMGKSHPSLESDFIATLLGLFAEIRSKMLSYNANPVKAKNYKALVEVMDTYHDFYTMLDIDSALRFYRYIRDFCEDSKISSITVFTGRMRD